LHKVFKQFKAKLNSSPLLSSQNNKQTRESIASL
jgi:hypothetical protein